MIERLRWGASFDISASTLSDWICIREVGFRFRRSITSAQDLRRLPATPLIGMFRRSMRDSALLKGEGGQNRTLYGRRHTYATFALLGGMDIHTLAKQLGNSAAMIEWYYSKLKPMLVAGKLG